MEEATVGTRFDIDLTQVPTLEPIPGGIYIVRIVGVRTSESQSGHPKATLETEIESPTEIAEKVPKWFINLSMHPNALFRVKNLFEAVGKLTQGGFDLEDLIDQRIGVITTFVVDPNYGAQNRIQKFLAVDKTKTELRGSLEDVRSQADAAASAAPATSAEANVLG